MQLGLQLSHPSVWLPIVWAIASSWPNLARLMPPQKPAAVVFLGLIAASVWLSPFRRRKRICPHDRWIMRGMVVGFAIRGVLGWFCH
jgi:hypothetical protein